MSGGLPKPELEAITRDLIDAGQLIEAGWIGLRHGAIAHDAPPVQLREMRMAFFAGAQHLFASIMAMLEPGQEATEADLSRMDKLQRELAEFAKAFREQRPGPN